MSDEDEDDEERLQGRVERLTGGVGGACGGILNGKSPRYSSLIGQPPTPVTDLGRLRSVQIKEADDGAPSASPSPTAGERDVSKKRLQPTQEALENVEKVHKILFGSDTVSPREMVQAVQKVVAMRPHPISPISSPVNISSTSGHLRNAGENGHPSRIKHDEAKASNNPRGTSDRSLCSGNGAHHSCGPHMSTVGEKRQRDGVDPEEGGGGRRSNKRRDTFEQGKQQGRELMSSHTLMGHEAVKERHGSVEENGAGDERAGGPRGQEEGKRGLSPFSPEETGEVTKATKHAASPFSLPASKRDAAIPAYPGAESPLQMGKSGNVLDEGKALKDQAQQCKKKGDLYQASQLYFKSSIKFLESASEEANTPPQRQSHPGFDQVSKMFSYAASLAQKWLSEHKVDSRQNDEYQRVLATEALSYKAAAICLMRNYQAVSKKRLRQNIKEVQNARYLGGGASSVDHVASNPTPPDSATSDGGDGAHSNVSPFFSASQSKSAKDQLLEDTKELMNCIEYWTLGCEKASTIRSSQLEALSDVQMAQPARLVQYLRDFAAGHV